MTARPQNLVSHAQEMDKIREAIFKEGDAFRIVLIKGAGGLGKTRILEEVLRRLGNEHIRASYGPPLPENDWSQQEPRPLFSDLLDLTDIKLHTREYIIEKLGDPIIWSGRINFSNYATAHDRWRRLADYGAAYTLAGPASQAAEAAFWQDYEEAAKTQRLVIPIDTTEQLAIISSKWLIDNKLLHPDDLTFNTQQWLLDQIRAGRFTNTTLLIAGRDGIHEGGPYFDLLKQAAREASGPCECIPVELSPFTVTEVRRFFKGLYDDWTAAGRNNGNFVIDNILNVLDALLQDEDHLRVLWLYTGGQPIRLSLYTDVLVEGRVPEPLQITSYAAAKKLTRSDGKKETPALLQARRKIEAEFIQILFGPGNGLRPQILRSLARSTRGLTAEQIHFILDSEPTDTAGQWQPKPDRLAEIEKELNNVRLLAIVKPKPGHRIGLQDEVYRIYAEAMSADEETRHRETKARQKEYSRLREWAHNRWLKLYSQDETYTRDDLARIRVERPANILSTRLPAPTSIDEERRVEIAAELLDAELEYLHYNLLLDPDEQFNDTYYSLANDRVIAYREEQVAMFQAESWRILHDNHTFQFVEISPRAALIERGERPIDVLRRAARITDATYWIVRFYLRKEYERAVSLADQIEQVVAKLKDANEYHAWSHSLARGERGVWREYVAIYQGKNVQEAIAMLAGIAQRLEALARVDTETPVFPENAENGFIGHPAYSRLLFVIATTYHNLGYGYATLGDFRQAVAAYAEALKYARRLPAPLPLLSAQEAKTRNNLSRALVEMGKKRSIRICQDALDLRIRLSDWIPIAYSYNTLGLIMNDLYQPHEALQACAIAWAIGQQVQDPRLLGLTLLQLGEALRRLANINDPIQPDSPEQLYREAERALQQARELFLESDARGEGVRIIEANIEIGCLYRDWMAATDKGQLPDIWNRRRRNVFHYLEEAVRLARESKLVRLELDAQVNIGWSYFCAGEHEEARLALDQAESLIPAEARLRADHSPPGARDVADYFFKQLSKVYGLRGLMAFETFLSKTKELAQVEKKTSAEKRQQIIHDDETMQTLLWEAADAYVQALGYAELFSPRSVALTVIYDRLYNLLKRLNSAELEDFYRYEREASRQYRIGEIKMENFGDLQGFLLDCFGDYYTPEITGVFN